MFGGSGFSASAPKRICLLVLGMRSGTSALTRCLSLLGAGLPHNLLPGNHSNETGHWEPEPVLRFNDRLLGAMDSRWDTLRDPDFGRLESAALARFRHELAGLLADEYGEASFIVLKEPRIGRLVPFYIDVLQSAGYDLRVILTRRDPHAVAQSFASRDDNGLGNALLLWTSYALSVERSTRGLSRTFVSYDELMLDPARVLLDAASELGVAYPRPLPGAIGEIRQHLAFEHYHNHPGQGVLPPFIADTHRALGALATHDSTALRMLDRQRELLTQLLGRFGSVIDDRMSVAHLAELCAAIASPELAEA